jgi:uncharacterized protein HemX
VIEKLDLGGREMKRFVGLVIFCALLIGSAGAALGQQQPSNNKSAKQAAKDAGRDTKRAAKNAGKAVKRATKKGVNKGAAVTRKGAGKVEEKTK